MESKSLVPRFLYFCKTIVLFLRCGIFHQPHQPSHANLKRIHGDSQEMKPCRVENDTKPVNTGFFSQVMSLMLVFTQMF